MGLFGFVQEAVNARMSTADLWAHVRDQAGARGIEIQRLGLQDMNQLRGIATGVRNAADALARAPQSNAITSDYIATAPWGRPEAEMAALDRWQVRFQHQFADENGEVQTTWRTVIYDGALPATVDALGGDLGIEAEAMAEEYGTAHIGIGAMQILRV